jgi:Zn-dependent protease with chaperone function
MQTAAENCKICESPLLSGVETAACPHCRNVSHWSCLESVGYACPSCGEIWNEAAAPSAETAADFPLRLEGELRPPRTSWLYRLSLALVSLAMVFLLSFYLGLIALFVYGLGYYAIHFEFIFPGLTDSYHGLIGLMLLCALYFGPIIIGLLLAFFLVKPLFAPKPDKSEIFSLNHADAPQLFALVGWICRSLNAPIPSRIDVDCGVNAGAGFRNGWRSIFTNDVILVIGLPLVGGMNINQFAGIITHEYGHFSQGSGMRAAYVIREINAWFYRVVRERDKWDVALERASEQEDQNIFLVAIWYLARLAVWSTRRVLWALMLGGHALSCFMSRQMEFDADRYQLRMTGSESFAGIMQRFRQLNLGSAAAIRQIREKWKKEQKLFDQIPDFIVSRANEIPAEAQEKFHAALARRKTRVFDMHPSDAERIERARAAREPGIFHDASPAATLFADFPELSRRLTLNYYQSVLGSRINAACLVSTDEARAQLEHDCAPDWQNIRRFFLGIAAELRPPVIAAEKTIIVRQHETLQADLQLSRRQMEIKLPRARLALAEYIHAETRRQLAAQASQLLQAGFQFDPSEFGLADDDLAQVQATAQATLHARGAELRAYQALGAARLSGIVQLLSAPQMAERIPNAAKRQAEAREIIWVLSRLGELLEPLQELRTDSAMLELLLRYGREQPAAENVAAALENLSTGIQERVNLLQEQTAQIRYPYPHAMGEIMVSEYARNKDYHANPFELAAREGKSHAEKLLDLYARLLGNLILICEFVENSGTSA